VSGNTAIVMGEAKGSPVADFMGVPPTGKSFRIMSIDMQTIENKKTIQSYHVEDWAGAMQQISPKQ
jgi:predicted ester cyclase